LSLGEKFPSLEIYISHQTRSLLIEKEFLKLLEPYFILETIDYADEEKEWFQFCFCGQTFLNIFWEILFELFLCSKKYA
jgi:hypothetical protein